MKELCARLGLGELISEERINEGLTNKLYKIVTTNGSYVIKVLNDNNSLDKIEKSEEISNIAKNSGINSICALKFNDKYIQEYNGNYLLIYKYCNGKILLTKELTLNHVGKLASILGTLHSIKVDNTLKPFKYNKIDYRKYYELLKDNKEDWSLLFREKIDELCELYNNVYDNYLKLSNQLSYVHKDFNRRNVLWENDIPYIIDWETATIDNPSIDFFNSAWFLTADVDIDKYTVFCTEYFKKNKLDDNINTAAHASIIEECNWLEFSLKRLQSNNIDEVNLGKSSISGSLTEILNYYNKIPLMINIIEKISKN